MRGWIGVNACACMYRTGIKGARGGFKPILSAHEFSCRIDLNDTLYQLKDGADK
jgi:hypothetical protein